MGRSELKKQMTEENSKTYQSFIKNLNLEDIRLVSAELKNLDCYYVPSNADIRWRLNAKYENKNGKIEIMSQYNVRILEKGKEPKATIKFTFCITYTSEMPMTDELFKPFKERNVPLQTWPYFREFVHNAVLRMGWPPFIAPIFVA